MLVTEGREVGLLVEVIVGGMVIDGLKLGQGVLLTEGDIVGFLEIGFLVG